ncbi:MAG: peptide-methionine (S)-S-oxide reductase MsrA [Candidatus Peregrinibacteria bacterium]|nr:peptide-methionine (S)-S-oxide reductase MsrA [Candidatus Peregrinibacteria bacterium]MDZ4244342.1 peptide-methionine (S)-S-oxide reductase MsrA [Candidatus Gracilibacteria bacterium]
MKKVLTLFLILIIMGIGACSINRNKPQDPKELKVDLGTLEEQGLRKAIFAGGCFWCVESAFDDLDGVAQALSGYTGGDMIDPTYKDHGDHLEAVEVVYDPTKITYNDLLNVFWRQINPTDDGGQFVDRGHSYTSAIFYGNDDEKLLAEKSKEELAASGRYEASIVTPILPAKEFYLAEEYHQDYHIKNPVRYKYYRGGSGRDAYLERIWGE